MTAMPATHALLELLGEVALLLWGVHMVRTGVLRAYGGELPIAVREAARERPQARHRCYDVLLKDGHRAAPPSFVVVGQMWDRWRDLSVG